MSTQQEIIEEIDRSISETMSDWIGDLIDERNYDRPMDEIQVIVAVELWAAEVDASELI